MSRLLETRLLGPVQWPCLWSDRPPHRACTHHSPGRCATSRAASRSTATRTASSAEKPAPLSRTRPSDRRTAVHRPPQLLRLAIASYMVPATSTVVSYTGTIACLPSVSVLCVWLQHGFQF